ncbi:hypothetical protein CA54_02850 [Symmachiella macrocystis]|uniref:Peptidase M20 dimerisation domain-containing protein n=1 Tax=Symmachiella macrocystis TaxID=2527985 RepID=A0A5C6BHF6_9PLAN|nr:peptidase [Symmachiella macrocystis]TWU11478.1 hypothetical protein CA54_02850 [Symmachiella macrocystis]
MTRKPATLTDVRPPAKRPTLTELANALTPLREEVLANLAMLAQIPVSDGVESQRRRYLLDRLVAAGLPEASSDAAGNAIGFLPGKTGLRTVMLVAHLGTPICHATEPDVVIEADRIVGHGVADNSLGAAVMSMVPCCLKELGITLDSNLQLIGSVRSLKRGHDEGLRYVLDHAERPSDFGLVLEGIRLGRLSTFATGTVRADIICNISGDSGNALIVLNRIIDRLLKIAMPTRPYTKIRLGQIKAGELYHVEPVYGELGLEVLSDSSEELDRIVGEIEEIVAESSASSGIQTRLDCFFRREPGGVPFSHSLVKSVVDVMSQLDIQPAQDDRPSELSEFIAAGIPAVTLGITDGQTHLRRPDFVMIEPILTGVAQIIGVLLEMDRGACDEH